VTQTPLEERPDKLLRRVDTSSQERQPRYCVWEVSLACDLGCKTCGSRAGKSRQDELSTAQCLDTVRQLEEIGIREVTLIGGEAYLREDWDIIAAEITKRGMAATITTGGRGMSADRIERAIDAGISSISVSIDGLERTHNLQRGAPKSWESALASCERIAASPMRLTTNTQVNRLSLPEVPAIAQLLIDHGSKAWQIQITVPMGRGADRPQMLLQPYDVLDFFPLLAWTKDNRLTPAGVGLFPGNNVGYFGPFEQLLRYGGGQGAHWSGCGAGKWCIGVEADGKIKGCPSLPSDEYTGGYTQNDSILEVLEDAVEVNQTRLRTVDDLWGFCRTCYYADVCKAGCTWTAHCTLGRPGNNPYCIHRATTYEAEGRRERLVHRRAAPGVPFDYGIYELELENLPPAGDTPATILGHPLDHILNLDWRDGSIWSDAELKDMLKRAPKLFGIK